MTIYYAIGYILGQLLALAIVYGITAFCDWLHEYRIEKECKKNREKYHRERGY